VLDPRTRRRVGRNGLSEERNNIEGETKREVKDLRMEVEKLKRELEARDMDDSRDQNESKTTIAKLTVKVQELDQQVTGLKRCYTQWRLNPRA